MKVKHRECREAETQLRMIEERLGMTPTQYNMPPSPATMLLTELSTPPARTATSRRAGARAAAAASASPNLSAPVVNGTSNTSGTTSSSRTRRGPPVAAEDVRSSKRTRRWKEWTFFSFFWSRSSAWTVLCRHRTKKKLQRSLWSCWQRWFAFRKRFYSIFGNHSFSKLGFDCQNK